MSVTSTPSPDDLTLHPADYRLWDFAGVDGLQAAIALFSPAVTQLAPFQSVTAGLNQQPCSVLRLCENNFRVALPAGLALEQAPIFKTLNVWVKPAQTLNLLLSPIPGLESLAQVATTKPLYTLSPFPIHRAVPARIHGAAILAWHHLWQGNPQLLLQMAADDRDGVLAALTRARGRTL